MNENTCLKICDSCPWLTKNQGQPHKDGWYTTKNLRRLWNGLRTGKAPGMICHSTDPKNVEYGGNAPQIKPGHEAECGGAVTLIIRSVNAVSEGEPQPVTPPMTRNGLAYWVERYLFGGAPAVEPERINEVGVPWAKKERDT